MELRERKSVGIVEMWGLDSGDEGAQEGKEELKLERQKSRRVSGGGMSCGKAKAVGGNRQIASKVVGKARGSVAMSGKSDERGSDRNARLKTARRTRRQSGGNLDKYYDDGNGTEKKQLTEVGTRGMEAVVMSGEEVCAKNTEKDDTNAVQLMKTVKLEQEEFAGVEKKEEEGNVVEEEKMVEEARRMESDDDMLVDVATDATASVLSPTVWIKKPLFMNSMHQGVHDDKENAPYEVPTSLHKGDEACGAEKKKLRRRTSIGDDLENEGNNAQPNRMYGAADKVDDGSAGMQDHHGFDVAGQIEKEFEESQREQQDLKEIADIEAEITRLREMANVLEASLAMKTGQVEELHGQNMSIKRMFSAIKVTKDDFNLEGLSQDQQREKMVQIGDRLVNMLRHGQDDLPLKEKLNTLPSGQTSLKEQKTAITPPATHPVESQIAAAALIAAKQDPARALVSLLEKSLEARRRLSL